MMAQRCRDGGVVLDQDHGKRSAGQDGGPPGQERRHVPDRQDRHQRMTALTCSSAAASRAGSPSACDTNCLSVCFCVSGMAAPSMMLSTWARSKPSGVSSASIRAATVAASAVSAAASRRVLRGAGSLLRGGVGGQAGDARGGARGGGRGPVGGVQRGLGRGFGGVRRVAGGGGAGVVRCGDGLGRGIGGDGGGVGGRIGCGIGRILAVRRLCRGGLVRGFRGGLCGVGGIVGQARGVARDGVGGRGRGLGGLGHLNGFVGAALHQV